MFRFEIPFMADLPRAWFISADDTMLVQLQQDRLLLNWRSSSGQGGYPHYPVVSAEFRTIFEALSAFVFDANLGALDVEQCEMTYINHMGTWPRDGTIAPENWLRAWSGGRGPEWDGQMEDFSSVARYTLRRSGGEPCGRVTAVTTTVIRPPAGDRSLQVEITVRGVPDNSTIDGVRGFHDIAHDQIVRCFSATTTDAAHEIWGRTRP
jgi:uncharacterized protein (TIGR04255 family)